MAGAAAADEIAVRVEVVEVGTDGPQRNHALDVGVFQFYIHSPLGQTGDGSVKYHADLVLHELDDLVLDALAFGLGGDDFTLGGVAALLGVVVLVLGIRPFEVHGEQAVDHHVGIAADRGSEVRVELECETVMADVVGAVAGLCHGAEGQQLEGVESRAVLGPVEEGVDAAGGLAAGARLAHLEAEIAGKLTQTADFLAVGLVMNTVDEGLGGLEGLAAELPARGDKLRDVAVRQEHKLLDEPVGFFGNALVHADGLAVFVDVDLHFRALEIDGAGGETLAAELEGQVVEGQDGFLDVGGNEAAFAAFSEVLLHGLGARIDDLLRELIGEPVVGDDFRPAEPGVDDLGLGCDFENGGEA